MVEKSEKTQADVIKGLGGPTTVFRATFTFASSDTIHQCKQHHVKVRESLNLNSDTQGKLKSLHVALFKTDNDESVEERFRYVALQLGYLTCVENAMIATVMASVAPIVMTTAIVLWKDAMAPTMYDKLRVTTTCRHKFNTLNISNIISEKNFHSLPDKFTSSTAWKKSPPSRFFMYFNNYSLVYV